jgi:integrase
MQDLLPIEQPPFSELDLKDKSVEILNGLDVSEGTRKDYVARIGLFIDFVHTNGFDRNTFLMFKRNLASRNDIAVSTKAKYLAVSRVFLRELHRLGIIPVDITQNVKGFSQSQKHKRFGLNDDEIQLLLHNLNQLEESKESHRLKTIIGLMLFQGLRQIEITRMDVQDVHFASGTAVVWGKGQQGKEDVIDLHPELIKILKNYMEYCKVKDGALIVSFGNRNINGRLNTRSIRRIVQDFFAEIGIVNFTHGFRHYFVTKLLREFSGDILKTRKFSRHRTTESILAYADDISKKDDLPSFYHAFDFSENKVPTPISPITGDRN